MAPHRLHGGSRDRRVRGHLALAVSGALPHRLTFTLSRGLNALAPHHRPRVYFLHSWDVPAILRAGSGRDAVLILLSAGGLAASETGEVIGWRQVKIKMTWG